MQTIQQHRARFALERVEHASTNLQAEKLAAFKARAAELPAMIQMNGLGQAAAFYRMKGEKHAHRDLYNVLSGWLCRAPGAHTPEGGIFHAHGDLIAGITHSEQGDYRVAQAEALALMEWVKRFAKAFIADQPAAHTAPPEED
ncbi:MAG: type III-B CRISPR module-associated protein Cmr5 [Chromatiales bacterium]|nr:type III-B CRISPR module-associated protein Cmr5 [Chromatiales bacterium]